MVSTLGQMAIIRLRPKVSDVSIHDSKLASLEIELLDSREIKSRNDDLILKEEEERKKSFNQFQSNFTIIALFTAKKRPMFR